MPDPRIARNIIIEINEIDYGAQANSVVHTSPELVSWQGGKAGVKYYDTPVDGHTLTVAGVQNYADPASLSSILHAAAGAKKTVQFNPTGQDGNWWSCEATILAPPIGGNFGEFAPFSLAFPATEAVRIPDPED